MATTVRGAFEEFAKRLELTEAQRSDATTKHTGVRDCLDRVLWVESAFLTGSFARKTIIRPPDDIDLFVVLDYSKHGATFYSGYNGAQLALEKFHSLLKDCYPTTPIRKDHPAVHLNFTTYGIDVVPAFRRNGGGYVIPSHVGSGWISTDPQIHADRTTAMNKDTGGYFVPITKMLKAWNRSHYSKLTGFHLEMMLANAWPSTQSNVFPFPREPVKFGTFATAAANLFPVLSAQLAYSTPDPASLSGDIDTYLSAGDRLIIRSRLNAASGEAQIALRHEQRADHYSVITKWQSIFGDPFPAWS